MYLDRVCVCRTYELLVNGGAPYEKDVAVEASVTRECMKTQEPARKQDQRIKRFFFDLGWISIQCEFVFCFHCYLAPTGVFQQMLHARRQPKLIIKLRSTNSRTRTQLRWDHQLQEKNSLSSFRTKLNPCAGVKQSLIM